MAQHDYVIDNSTGANVRADINNALLAISSNNSGSSAPSTTYALQTFANTTDSMLQLRNATNDAFINLRKFDGTLPLPDGTNSAPSLFFDDDTNTGLYSSAADTLNFATGGTERLELGTTTIFNEDGADVDFRIEGDTDANLFYVDAGNDRVGISTSTPECEFQVAGKVKTAGIGVNVVPIDGVQVHVEVANPRMMLKSTGTNAAKFMFGDQSNNDAGVIEYAHSTNVMSFATGTLERMRIDSSGQVGIGTTSPSVTLDIEAITPTIRLTDSNATGTPECEISGGGGDLRFSADRDDEKAGTVMQFQTDGSTAMIIDASQQVGIGQTSPEGKVHIEKASSGATYSADGSDVLIIENSDSVGIDLRSPAANSGNILFSDANARGSGRIFYEHNNNAMVFCTNGVSNERIRIDSGGRVGIGTTSPSQRLVVNNGSDNSDVAVFTGGDDSRGLKITTSAATGPVNDGVVTFNAQTASVGTLAFAVANGSEAMRINADQTIGMGIQATQDARLFIAPNVDGTVQRGITISGRKDVYDVIAINFVHATTNSSAGSVQFTTTAAVQYNTTSDYRLKQDVATLTDSITKLKQLNPVHFKWKDMPSVESDGFLAHEVQTVVPSAITGEKDALDKDGNIEPQQIDIGGLTPLLTSALQEAVAKIEVLETKVAALEAA